MTPKQRVNKEKKKLEEIALQSAQGAASGKYKEWAGGQWV